MFESKISVTNLVMDGRKASATVTVKDFFGTTRQYDVNTNREGSGLWVNGKQTLGTCQFGVTSAASARAALRRYFQD